MTTYNAILFNDYVSTLSYIRPAGVNRLATEAREQGFSCLTVEQLSFWLRYDFEALKRLLLATTDDTTLVVGFSTTFWAAFEDNSHLDPMRPPPLTENPPRDNFEDLLGFIKVHRPKCKIVLGGARSFEMRQIKHVDIELQGYADTSFIKLLRELKSGTFFPTKKQKQRSVVDNDLKAASFDFKRSVIDYPQETFVQAQEVLPIEIGRGCIFRCKFCGFPLNGKRKRDHVKDEEVLYTELLNNYTAWGVTRYSITDDTFNDDIEKLLSIARVVQMLPFKPEFVCYLRLDLIAAHPEIAPILRSIGITAVHFGIETLHKQAGSIIGKSLGKERALKAIELARKELGPDCNLHASLIIGLPYETAADCVDSARLLSTSALDGIFFFPLRISRDVRNSLYMSEFDKDHAKYGYTFDPPESTNWKTAWMNCTETSSVQAECRKILRAARKETISGFKLFDLLSLGFTHAELKGKDLLDRAILAKAVFLRQSFYNTYKEKLLRHFNVM